MILFCPFQTWDIKAQTGSVTVPRSHVKWQNLDSNQSGWVQSWCISPKRSPGSRSSHKPLENRAVPKCTHLVSKHVTDHTCYTSGTAGPPGFFPVYLSGSAHSSPPVQLSRPKVPKYHPNLSTQHSFSHPLHFQNEPLIRLTPTTILYLSPPLAMNSGRFFALNIPSTFILVYLPDKERPGDSSNPRVQSL